jgi:hypothetical protein
MTSFLRAQCLALTMGALVTPSVLAQEEAPKLVVMLIVDQLRGDLLDRYEPAFSGGFRRLLDEGFRFTQASHAHARTSTAPGHATLTTGVFPSRHGVVANSWFYDLDGEWRLSYAVADPPNGIVGFENVAALEGRSPVTMLREGLPDWLHAQDDDSRRISISKKDRAAIPMGGQTSEHVYWLLPELGRFITSRHYMRRYPRWLDRFNDRVMPDIADDQTWESEVPEQFRALARPDAAVYEGDGVHTVFPHVGAEEVAEDHEQARNMWGFDQSRVDDAVMALAHEVIDEFDLGQRREQDFLAISLSATDRVGHAFGPFSQEQLSNLINVDQLLGEFFEYLDEEVGEGAWLVGLAGDHGVVTIPEAQVELGINPDAERISDAERTALLAEALNQGVRAGGSPEEIAERVARLIEQRGLVAKAYTHSELTRAEPADSFAVLFRNSYYPGRPWGPLSRWSVEVRFEDGDLVGFPRGTNHETTYWYDRHVEMIFMGAGVEPGASDAPVYTVDFAPTLAGLAGIPVPGDLDGRRIF